MRRRDVIFNEANFDIKSVPSPQMIVELNSIEVVQSKLFTKMLLLRPTEQPNTPTS